MGIGACNAERWCIHKDAGPFEAVSVSLSQNRIETFYRSGEYGCAVRQQRAGDVWNWKHPVQTYGAMVWIGLDSEDTLQYVWESEDIFDQIWTCNPMLIVTPINREILSGGTWRQMVMPDEDILSTLATEVTTAEIPAWLTGTRFDGKITTAANLLQQLFDESQAADGYYYGRFEEYTDYINDGSLSLRAKNYLTLLWLRAASRILYDHKGESMIPLAVERFSVDASTGLVTLN